MGHLINNSWSARIANLTNFTFLNDYEFDLTNIPNVNYQNLFHVFLKVIVVDE